MSVLGTDVVAIRCALDELAADYADALDEDRLEVWPELFVDDGVYEVISRENVAADWPLATMSCHGRAAMFDRVQAIRSTVFYVPRGLRHVVAAPRVRPADEGWVAEANFAVFETLPDDLPRVFATGRYHDRVVDDGGRLRFTERRAVYDGDLVPNSLILPL